MHRELRADDAVHVLDVGRLGAEPPNSSRQNASTGDTAKRIES